jgi:hypothetical protein
MADIAPDFDPLGDPDLESFFDSDPSIEIEDV